MVVKALLCFDLDYLEPVSRFASTVFPSPFPPHPIAHIQLYTFYTFVVPTFKVGHLCFSGMFVVILCVH